MKRWAVLLCLLAIAPFGSAAEILFTSGPQEIAGQRYYWLAEWKLEVTLPEDVAADDRLEVLFGTKGPLKRTMGFEYDGRSGSFSDVRQQVFEWIELPLGELVGGKKVTLFGQGDGPVAFLAGIRVTGRSAGELQVTPVRTRVVSSGGSQAATWAELPGFDMNDENRPLWEPAPKEPDWDRAQRSAQYAGIPLSKVQPRLHESCLPIRTRRPIAIRSMSGRPGSRTCKCWTQ